MATRYTLTINTDDGRDGGSEASECQKIAEMLERAAQVIQSTHATSGTITDRNNVGTCTFTYTPTAAA
jgi:hypothetical protein